MDFEEVLKVVDAAVIAKTKRHLKDIEVAILRGSWQDQKYHEIAEIEGYTTDYLKQDVGPKLWKLLSEALGEKVSKTNFQVALERQCQAQLSAVQKPQAHIPSDSGPEAEFDQLLRQLQRTSMTAMSTIKELSPFIAGPPITHPHHFFGRERQLKRLFNLWKHPPLQNAALIGPRHSGKTSLLLYLKSITTTPPSHLRPGQRADWLPTPERYRWILVDFQDPRLGSRKGLLRYLLTCLDLPVPNSCDLDCFLDAVSRSLRTPTVILLDGISVAIQRYCELDDSFWESLRSLANNQVEGNLAFVLAAREPPDQLAGRSHLGSPFFNIFGYTAQLKPMTDEEAHELIASSPIRFPPADIDWILDQSRCWPILLQILCRERLVALEAGETDDAWKKEGLDQIKRYGYLLEN